MHRNAQKFEWKTQSKIADFFELEASPLEGQSLQQNDKKLRKRKGAKKNEKPKDKGHFIKILISVHAEAKRS